MAQKFHIDKNGKPAPCHATKRPCPLGGDDVHFDSMEEAQAHADKLNEEQFGLLGSTESDHRDTARNVKRKSVWSTFRPGEDNYDTFLTFLGEDVNIPDGEFDIVMHRRFEQYGEDMPYYDKVVKVHDSESYNGSAFYAAVTDVSNGIHHEGLPQVTELNANMMEDGRLELHVVSMTDVTRPEGANTLEYSYNLYAVPRGEQDLADEKPEEVFTEDNLIKFYGY